MSGMCHCPACGARRLTAPLILVAAGIVLLAHMAHPGFTSAAAVGAFLAFVGALALVQRILPQAEGHAAPASLFFPLLLLAIGVLILIRHWLPSAPVGQWIANYWPLLLIVWGLTRLLEHYTRAPRARSGLSGGEVVLLVFIVVFGLGFSGAYRFGHSQLADYWGVHFDTWNPLLESYHYAASAHAALPARTAEIVVIRGYRGNVTLAPGSESAITADVSDTVRAGSSAEAQRVFSDAQPLIQPQGDSWLVLPAGNSSHRSIAADLKLTLPPSVPVTVELDNGDVTVPSWNADLDIRTTHGEVTANHIQGNVRVTSGHDSVNLDQVSGSVTVTGSGEDVSLSNISGPATLEGEFVGSLNFRNLAQGIHFSSTRTELTLAALPGTLDYDMGQIAITQARNLSLHTRDEEIVVRDFTGPLEVQSRNDSITLASSAPLAAPIQVANHDADITLSLPAASRFQLTADAGHNGEVQNEFGEAAQAAGPAVSLTTTEGTIAVRRVTSSAALPADSGKN